MEYITERVINISEIEKLIRSAYYETSALRKETKKESPSFSVINELSERIYSDLSKAAAFEFCVERRKTVID